MRASDAQSTKMSGDKAESSAPRTDMPKARALRSVDKKLLTPAKMLVSSPSRF